MCSQSEEIPDSKIGAAVTPPSMIHQPTNTPNPFDRLKTHTTMATLNSILVPWLIAEFGIDYADWDNQKTATAMIAHVTRDNKAHKMTSILGEGTNDRERAMYWILGKFLSISLARPQRFHD